MFFVSLRKITLTMTIKNGIFVVVAAVICAFVTSCSVKTVDVAFDPDVKDYTPVVVGILKDHPRG